ncbi:MAG: hypothetical protein HQ556_01230 [Candidatus Marinimicrobia bacterium]|nr:hypothetical protein [Candidatus Neomarinimicrobiota bacterium]
MLFLIFTLNGYSQVDAILGSDELDDPDETQYLDQLLTALFQPFSIESADTTLLIEHGYSREAIEVICKWQKGNGTLKSLQRGVHGKDLILLKKDIKMDAQQTQIHLRQRLQYSPSLNGWRILNKGRIWNKWGSVNVLTEQDPGENQLTDHSILTFSSHSVPWFDHLILGEFHVNWGGGLILNQQGSRPSLNPRSLLRTRQSTIRPHYSSREIDYFQGVAGSFSYSTIQVAAFVSSRIVEGLWTGHQFREDADGIHPAGKILESRRTNDYGLALEALSLGTQLYASTIYNPEAKSGLAYELGLSRELAHSQKIQVCTNSLDFTNHRMTVAWAYFTSPLQVSLQYRHYITDEVLAPGFISTLLGRSASNEKGISARAQVRPTRKLQIRYALDTGNSVELQTVNDYRTIQQHKFQVIQKLDEGVFQFDYSRKLERSILEGVIWGGQFSSHRITRGAVSLVHNFSPQFKYRVNLKSAFSGKESAVLVQQRLLGEKGSWKWTIGHVRFSIPDYTMRLSVYETSVAESFSFYTAFDDGDRWFVYLKQQNLDWFDMEMKLVQTRSFDDPIKPKQLAISLQMSVVL